MRKAVSIFYFALVCALAACGPTTRPWDLATQQSQATAPSQAEVEPAATVAGTQVILPLIAQQAVNTPKPTPAPVNTPTLAPASLRFAVIGDYGSGSQAEADVANLVLSWSPEFIITTGDNNYPDGSDETIDSNVGQFFHAFIHPYSGSYGQGADVNRFFPSLGNHDWSTANAQPYLDYFTLPGNERYYDFTWGEVHFFVLDSDSREPDGVGSSSPQGVWLQQRLAESQAAWQIVTMHHAPYSSGMHGGTDWAIWPYQAWGADAVLAGHDHTYERLQVNGIPYFVNGLGGGAIYDFINIDPNSQARYNNDYGAMLVEADGQQITFQFINRQGQIIDAFTVEKP
jgi:hypothetical protein